MTDNIVTWNIPNFITVGVMGFVFLTALGFIASFAASRSGNAG